MKVHVDRALTQITDGSHYQGIVTIGGVKLDFDIQFAIPIPELENRPPAASEDEVLRLFQLIIRKDSVEVPLSTDERFFFIWLLASLAFDFYSLPQTRSSNEGLMGQVLNGEGIASAVGVTASIGMTGNVTIDLPEATCNMLRNEKFGCVL